MTKHSSSYTLVYGDPVSEVRAETLSPRPQTLTVPRNGIGEMNVTNLLWERAADARRTA
jgi:hypothetical protein